MSELGFDDAFWMGIKGIFLRGSSPCHSKEWRPWWQLSFSLARTSKTVGAWDHSLVSSLSMVLCETWVSRHEESDSRKTGACRSPFLEAGLTQRIRSRSWVPVFCGSWIYSPFSLFSCLGCFRCSGAVSAVLFSPQPPHSKLWRECLSIGLLTEIFLSFRSKTCLIFLSKLLAWSLPSPLDNVRFILSRDRSQLEDCSSERELFSLTSGLFLRHPFEAPAVCCVLRGGCTDERDTAFPQGELGV